MAALITKQQTPPDPIVFNALISAAQSLLMYLHTDSFYDQLSNSLNRIVPHDSLVVLGFKEGKKPAVIYDALHPREKSSFYDIYMAGAYLLSPLYQNWQELPSGVFRIDGLGQDELEDSEFSRAYYKDCGLCDEANFVVQISSLEAIAVCFGRQQLPLPFNSVELHYLHLIEPMFRTALLRHYQSQSAPTANQISGESSGLPGHAALSARLQNLGASLLTEREQQVFAQILKGKTSKLAARELRISPETERSHRKKIYTKFGVNSQTELFSLVLSHVVSLQQS